MLALVLGLCALAAPGGVEGSPYASAGSKPLVFISPNLLGMYGISPGLSASDHPGIFCERVRVLSVDASLRSARVGLAAVEYHRPDDVIGIPVSLGVTIWQRPEREFWRLYRMLPVFYADATVDLFPVSGFGLGPPARYTFAGHAGVTGEAVFGGIGVGVGLRYYAIRRSLSLSDSETPQEWHGSLAVEINLKVLATSLKL